MWMRSALSAAAMLLRERGDFFQLHAGRGMQFVARDGRAFGDVAERHLDVELRERLLHQPRVGHQFLLRLGRLERQVRVLEEIQRRQLVIADHRRGGHGDGLWPLGHPGFGRRGGEAGDDHLRLGLGLGRLAIGTTFLRRRGVRFGFAGFVGWVLISCQECPPLWLRRLPGRE